LPVLPRAKADWKAAFTVLLNWAAATCIAAMAARRRAESVPSSKIGWLIAPATLQMRPAGVNRLLKPPFWAP
jgi:hypothetical protein